MSRGRLHSCTLGCCLVLVVVAGPVASEEARLSAQDLLAGQPKEIVDQLFDEHLVIMQEVRESGSLSGGIIVGLVIFEAPVESAYASLSQTHRQGEFRSEIDSIRTVSRGERGPVDEHHMQILFTHYTYRLQYTLEPSTHRIVWTLAPDFENDLARVEGFWELFALDEGRSLARFGTRVDVGPLVPAFLQDAITREKVPATMERTRRWVNAEQQKR